MIHKSYCLFLLFIVSLHSVTDGNAQFVPFERDTSHPLTQPSVGVSNFNRTNQNGELIFYENDIISRKVDPNCTTSSEYHIVGFVGNGSCGQVMKAVKQGSDQKYAIKVIKHAHTCTAHSIHEKNILETVGILFLLQFSHPLFICFHTQF